VDLQRRAEFTQPARPPRPASWRRGQPLTGQFSLYPYLTAPAWFFDDTKSGYEAAKLIGVLGMTLAFFPAYGLARIVVSRPAAILAALGATMIPAYAYTSILVEEPLAYPWAALSLYLAARWYLRPTRRVSRRRSLRPLHLSSATSS
jgi:4-amino-4-deoxy-L-arabinose transferase-like glycosyltransferase